MLADIYRFLLVDPTFIQAFTKDVEPTVVVALSELR